MFSPDLDALHAMAEQLGVRKWFQNPETMNVRWPHYDIDTERREIAITLGAMPLNRYQTVVMADYIRRKPLRQTDFPPYVEALEWLNAEIEIFEFKLASR